MNILRLSTLSLTLAIAAFSLGYVNPSFAGKPDSGGNHNHGGGSTGDDDATYEVFIDGDRLTGISLQAFPWSGGGGNKTISGRQHNAGVLTNLNIFSELVGGPFTEIQGAACFPPNTDFPLEAGIITKKKGDAEVSLWFKANTWDNSDTTLFYQLHFTGDFESDWLPVVSTDITMNSWSLTATNEGNDIKAISCIGEGNIGPANENDIQYVYITVTALP